MSKESIEVYVNLINRKFGEGTASILPGNDIQLSKPVGESSNFVRQYFQHNIEDVKALPYKEKKKILSRLRANSMKDIISFGVSKDNLPDYLQADGVLFERRGGFYHRVNELGGFGINEFNVTGENNISIFSDNNYTTEGKISESVSPIEEIEEEETQPKQKTAIEYVVAVAEKEGKFQALAKLLLPYIEKDVRLVQQTLIPGVDGVYDVENKVIFISNTIHPNSIVPVILEEVLHSITRRSVDKDFSVDIVDGNLKFTFSETASAYSRTMAKVYQEGWNAIKNHLAKKLGSEEAALNQINSVMDRVSEAKKALVENKSYNLNLNEDEHLIYRASNIHEFLAGMFFNPEFQEILNNTEYLKSEKSIFDKFIELLSRILLPGLKDNHLLKASIETLVGYLEDTQTTTKEKMNELKKAADKIDSTEGEIRKLMIDQDFSDPDSNLMLKTTKDSSSLLLSPSLSNNTITLTSEAQLIKDKSFRGLPIQFVSEIRGNSNIGASLVNRSKILVNLTALKEKFNTKAWTKSREGWEDLITYPEDQFKTFDEWLTFVMLHEYSHSKIFRQEGESAPNYENRINNNAMKMLNETSVVQLELDFNENITEENKVYETDVLKSRGKFPSLSIKGDNTYSVEFIKNTSKESYPMDVVIDLVYSLNKNNKGKERFVYKPTEKEGYYVINRTVVPTTQYFENKSENISDNLC